MGLPYEVFKPGKPKELTGTTNLVIVSADCVTFSSWQEAIATLNRRRPVVHQIIDEAHIPLLSQDFRRHLRNMSDIHCYISCQLVLLTASAADRMVKALTYEFCLGPVTLVLRAPSNQPELAYFWKRVRSDDLVDRVRLLLDHNLNFPEDRAIVFVRTYAASDDLANRLNLSFYHGGDHLTDTDRAQIYQYWHKGYPVTCLFTSAFGTGNDYPHVRLVIHAGSSIEMTNYIQEAARAGRDGHPARCYLLQHEDLSSNVPLGPGDLDLHG